MKLNELRIGNLIMFSHADGEPYEIFWFNNIGWSKRDDFNGDIKNYYEGIYYNRRLEPIPLTDEWLLRFGFEKISTYEYSLDKINYPFNYKDGKVNITPGGIGDDTYGIDIPCKYVHQLQNLYFALTGEELIYKP